MTEPRVNEFHHREFWVAIVKSGNAFKAAGYVTPQEGGPQRAVAFAEAPTREEVEAESRSLRHAALAFDSFDAAIWPPHRRPLEGTPGDEGDRVTFP